MRKGFLLSKSILQSPTNLKVGKKLCPRKLPNPPSIQKKNWSAPTFHNVMTWNHDKLRKIQTWMSASVAAMSLMYQTSVIYAFKLISIILDNMCFPLKMLHDVSGTSSSSSSNNSFKKHKRYTIVFVLRTSFYSGKLIIKNISEAIQHLELCPPVNGLPQSILT